ncbi:glycosyltransferase [Alkalihalobacillus trypoxylicola]|uniref:Glycosyltransferase n=2 Tax=Alkalihalobacillus trypoxylicola TaxID=519424 RepID=A0A162DR23_9BACI|nr:glycosyltransferase [Alkalihalobacillus trypoxylicola]
MSDNSLETVGGEQESTKIIIKGIKDYYKVGVIQPGDVSNPVKGVEYYHVNSKKRIKHLVRNPFVFLSYIIRVRRLIIYKSPKMIHTQAQVSFFIVALLSKFKLIPKNIKLIHTERGLYTKYNSFFKRVFHFFMKELDVLVTTTKFNMNYWKEAMEQRNQFVEYKVIENTAGEIFESYDNQLENLKPDKSIVIGFAGRYCDWKNWPLAVEICKKLNDELGNKLHVKMAVGCLDDKAKHDTQNMFDNLKSILGERFQGLVNIDIEAMNKYYYELDVFILTSDYNTESFGRTLVEAMSRKTIVLTTNAGGAVEVVGNKKNVYNTVEGFSERILNLLAHPHIMDYEKEENLLRVKEKYSLINNIEKHLKLYNHYNN